MNQLRNLRRSSLLRRAVVPALVLALTVPSLARGQATELSRVPEPAEVRAVRHDLIAISQRLQLLTDSPEERVALAELEQLFGGLADEDFAQVARPLGRMLGELRARVDGVYESAIVERDTATSPARPGRRDVDLGERGRGGDGSRLRSTTPPFPLAPYPQVAAFQTAANEDAAIDQGAGTNREFSGTYAVDCNRSERLSYQTRFNLKAGLLIAEAIRDVATRLCEQLFLVVGVGTNFSLACIITDTLYHVTRVFEEFPALCDAIINSAEIEGSYDRLGYIHEQFMAHDAALTAHGTRIANKLQLTQTNVLDRIGVAQTNLSDELGDHDTDVKAALGLHDTEIKANLAAHDGDIKALLAADGEFFLRTAIERLLHRERRLAVVYLPEAFGGQLGKVATIVTQVVQDVQASGESTNFAQQRLTQANEAAALGQFKRAWSLYNAAYFEAIKVVGELR